MINHKTTFYLGVFVFLIPFLGFPTSFKMGLVVFAGIILVLTSIRIPVPKRILKNKNFKKDNISETPNSFQTPINSEPKIIIEKPIITEEPKQEIKNIEIIKVPTKRGRKPKNSLDKNNIS